MIIAKNQTGQMCNQMIEFMHLYVEALEHKATLVKVYDADFQKYFVCQHDKSETGFELRWKSAKTIQRIESLFKAALVKLRGNRPLPMVRQNWDVINSKIRAGKTVVVKDSFYRNFELLTAHKSAVVKYFTFKDEVRQCDIDNLEGLKGCVVGVHLRRKDYRVYADGKYFFEDEIILKWMKQLLSERECTFLLFSDEKINRENYCDLPVRFMEGNAGEDLYSMSQCEYLLAPLSTYAWMAHFLGQNKLCIVEDRNADISFKDFHKNVIGVV